MTSVSSIALASGRTFTASTAPALEAPRMTMPNIATKKTARKRFNQHPPSSTGFGAFSGDREPGLPRKMQPTYQSRAPSDTTTGLVPRTVARRNSPQKSPCTEGTSHYPSVYANLAADGAAIPCLSGRGEDEYCTQSVAKRAG